MDDRTKQILAKPTTGGNGAAPEGREASELGSEVSPRWQVRFDPVDASGKSFEFDLIEEMLIGSAPEAGGQSFLKPYDLRAKGVSRLHIKLRPAPSHLYVVDLGSTNGSWLNGRALEANHAYPLSDGDMLALGKLEFFIHVKQQPPDEQDETQQPVELADVLARMAKAITAQLELDDVLRQALEMAMQITNAREVSVWLIDERTSELFLEAERGIQDDTIRRMRLPVDDTMVGKVFKTGESLRAHREGEQVKVKTGYLVEAVLYVPLVHGDTTFGVMAAAHRDPARVFSPEDEKLLEGIADFAAIAIHNARLYNKAQLADRLKGEMIQNISHEFRSPLTYIIGYVELLLEERDKLSDEQRRGLEVIRLQAEKLVWLIKNFVALQPLDDPALTKGEANVVEVLQTVVESARLHTNEKQLKLSMEVEGHLPAVRINHMALLQIMDNLLSNAIKFTPNGGQITIRAQHNATGKVQIAVVDTGIGITKENHERIFERFVQLDGTMSRPFGGVGLGLAVCKTLIEGCGEKIWVDSEPGKGATFTFTLPPAASS